MKSEGNDKVPDRIIRILPVQPASAVQRHLDPNDEHARSSDFLCRWAGDPFDLKEVLLARVDWGPFDVSCRRHPEIRDQCLCTVRYMGPRRERAHLMASFWHVMERFPFYIGRKRAPLKGAEHAKRNFEHSDGHFGRWTDLGETGPRKTPVEAADW